MELLQISYACSRFAKILSQSAKMYRVFARISATLKAYGFAAPPDFDLIWHTLGCPAPVANPWLPCTGGSPAPWPSFWSCSAAHTADRAFRTALQFQLMTEPHARTSNGQSLEQGLAIQAHDQAKCPCLQEPALQEPARTHAPFCPALTCVGAHALQELGISISWGVPILRWPLLCSCSDDEGCARVCGPPLECCSVPPLECWSV